LQSQSDINRFLWRFFIFIGLADGWPASGLCISKVPQTEDNAKNGLHLKYGTEETKRCSKTATTPLNIFVVYMVRNVIETHQAKNNHQTSAATMTTKKTMAFRT